MKNKIIPTMIMMMLLLVSSAFALTFTFDSESPSDFSKLYVRANEDLVLGDVVYACGSTGGVLDVCLGDWDDDSTAIAVGFVTETIDEHNYGYVKFLDGLSGFDTTGQFDECVAGDVMYLGDNGQLTCRYPDPDKFKFILGYVLNVHPVSGNINMILQSVPQPEYLSYTDINTSVDDSFMYYDNDTELWKNKQLEVSDIKDIEDEYYNQNYIDILIGNYYLRSQIDNNFYNKTESDSRFLQSYTETDSIALAELNNYYDKTESDGRYLQSFTETDSIALTELSNNYYDKSDLFTKEELDERFYKNSNPLNLIGNGNFQFKNSNNAPYEWSSWDGTKNALVSSSVIIKDNVTIVSFDSSEWSTSNLKINLTVSGLDMSYPYLEGKSVTFKGSIDSSLEDYNLEIVNVYESENILEVIVPPKYGGYIGIGSRDISGENVSINTISKNAGTALRLKSGVVNKNNYLLSSWNEFNPRKPLAISFDYLVKNGSSTSYDRHLVQVEIKDSNGKKVYRYNSDFSIFIKYPCGQFGPNNFGSICENWVTASKTFEALIDPINDDGWGNADALASLTDVMSFRVVIKPYENDCAGGTACTDFYVTGLTVNNGYNTYSNAPKYINQKGDQYIYGDLFLDGNLEVQGCIKYDCDDGSCDTLGDCI